MVGCYLWILEKKKSLKKEKNIENRTGPWWWELEEGGSLCPGLLGEVSGAAQSSYLTPSLPTTLSFSHP